MTAVYLFPGILSALLLGAHFLRYNQLALVLCSLAIIPILFVRRPWAGRTAQGALILGALTWAQTLFSLMRERLATGEPYLRMTLILGAVGAVALIAAALVQSGTLHRHFRLSMREAPSAAGESQPT